MARSSGAAIRTAENNIITMSFADAYTMLLGMAAWGQSLYAVSWGQAGCRRGRERW